MQNGSPTERGFGTFFFKNNNQFPARGRIFDHGRINR